MQSFKTTYENMLNEFNTIVQTNGLQDEMNSFIVATQENSQFNDLPHIGHVSIALSNDGNHNTEAMHHVVDWTVKRINHKNSAELENQQKAFSVKLMDAFRGFRFTYTEPMEKMAIVQLMLSTPYINYLHPAQFQEFQNLRGKLENEITLPSYLLNSENSENLKLLGQSLDLSMKKIVELREMQAGANKFIVNTHNDIKELILQLKEQGVELNQKQIEILQQSQSAQQDLQKILNYLQNDELQKENQKNEIKIANYQTLSNACDFVCGLGSVIGSQDLIRIGQITQACNQIHYATEQLLTTSFVGTAILNPYMAIGMAALKMFSLFQKSDNPQKIMMKQLANIARQIKALHQDMLKRFGRIDEKLNHIFEKMLAGFQHLEIMSQVYVENKLDQIHSEILTLTNITQTGFEKTLTNKLFKQVQHVEDIKKAKIKLSLSLSEFNEKMGNLFRFISKESCSELFNGLIYRHLLKDVSGNTPQIINICSQSSDSIWHSLLGILVKFAKNNLNIADLNQIRPEEIFHPGFWQIAVATYCDMLTIYKRHYNYDYDPERENLVYFKKQGEQLLKVISLFSSNKQLYKNFIELISQQSKQIENKFKESSCSIVKHQCQPKLLFEIPEKVKKSEKNKKLHEIFFTIENAIQLLKNAKKEIPAVFINAQALGLGYLEFQWHLPVRSREHKKHKGQYAICKGQKAGLEVTFVTGMQKINILTTYISEKYHSSNLNHIYSYILSHSKYVCSTEVINQMSQMINKDKLNSQKEIALKIAQSLQQDAAYHQLLKLNHFLIAYLNLGGFSEELILEVKNNLLLDDVAEQFACFAKNPNLTALPELKIFGKNSLNTIQKLIFSEINKIKNSQIAACIHKGILCLYELEIRMQFISKTNPESSYKPGQTQVEFFSVERQNSNSAIRDIKCNDVEFTLKL